METISSSLDMSHMLSILRAIAGQLDFKAIINAVSTEVSTLLPHDHLDVAIMSADRTVVTSYETGLHTEWDVSICATKPVKVSPIRGLFTREVEYILTDDAQSDIRFHFEGAFSRPIFSAGLRSRLHVPLMVERKIIGALSFSTQQIGTYCTSSVHTAHIVADILSPYFFALQQSALAKQNELQQVHAEAKAEGLRIGALHLTEELENARQAIGMDLHDQTLADLTRISRNLKPLVGKNSVRGMELSPLQEEIEHCLCELKIIIDNAKPSVLQFFGFGQAIESLLERSIRSTVNQLSYHLHDNGSYGIDELPAHTIVPLYRIVQEAINNAVRHSCASKIQVWINMSECHWQIVIEDDGIGLINSQDRSTGGMINMQTRASLIQAKLEVTPGLNGAGTRIEIALPMSTALI